MLRIFLADSVGLVRRGIACVLETQPGWQITGEAADGMGAVKGAASSQSEVVILGMTLAGLGGLQAARKIKEAAPGCGIVFLSRDPFSIWTIWTIEMALRTGARGYYSLSDAEPELVKAVRAVSEKQLFFNAAGIACSRI